MKPYWKNERGAAMIIEAILLVAVLGAMAYAGLHIYREHHTVAATTTATTTPSPAPSGPVSNTVNSIIAGESTESAAAAQDNSETSAVTATASNESNITGAYNEDSF